MKNEIQKVLNAAVLGIMRPLARVLLRHGVAYGTFAELARKAYVDVAFEDAGLTGKRPTISGVSALTGLTRKETKRLRELDLDQAPESLQRYNRAMRIIGAWVSNPRFQDENGDPADLAIDGDAASFTALVKDFSGDIPPTAMLSVLQGNGSVAVSEGRVSLLEKAYIPQGEPVDRINILGTDVGELIGTIGHNLTADAEDRLFQRKVFNVLVKPEAVPEFRRLSNQRSQQLLEEYHAWLSEHEIEAGDAEESGHYVAVGIYYTEASDGDGGTE